MCGLDSGKFAPVLDPKAPLIALKWSKQANHANFDLTIRNDKKNQKIIVKKYYSIPLFKVLFKPFNRQITPLEFLPTWSCVSLTRSTTSSEWK